MEKAVNIIDPNDYILSEVNMPLTLDASHIRHSM